MRLFLVEAAATAIIGFIAAFVAPMRWVLFVAAIFLTCEAVREYASKRAPARVALLRAKIHRVVIYVVVGVIGAAVAAVYWAVIDRAVTAYVDRKAAEERKVPEVRPDAPAASTPNPQELFAQRLANIPSDEELLKEFPEGFALFNVSGSGDRRIVTPYHMQVDESRYRFDWSKVQLTLRGDEYELRGPDIEIRGLPGFRWPVLISSLSRDRAVLGSGVTLATMAGGSVREADGSMLYTYVAIVAFRQEGIVYVVGFGRER